MEENTTELTYGQKLVGVNFNPSQDPKVARLKELAAEMADILDLHRVHSQSDLQNVLFQNAIGEILNGQMNAVKFVTNKY